MSDLSTFGVPTPRRLFGAFKSWLRAPLDENWLTSEAPPLDVKRPAVHAYGLTRVLVVDDNPVNLMVISALLESRGLVPLLAADGAEAVALVCKEPVDLILMDLQMPVLDGLGATVAIRRFESIHARSPVPVVAYSSTSMGLGVLATYGLNGSLNKPCGDQELEDCLVQWCPSYCPAPAHRGARPRTL